MPLKKALSHDHLALDLSKASPCVPSVCLAETVPIIEASCLVLSAESKDQDIGHGRFGFSSKQVFRDSFVVCVKQLHHKYSYKQSNLKQLS